MDSSEQPRINLVSTKNVGVLVALTERCELPVPVAFIIAIVARLLTPDFHSWLMPIQGVLAVAFIASRIILGHWKLRTTARRGLILCLFGMTIFTAIIMTFLPVGILVSIIVG